MKNEYWFSEKVFVALKFLKIIGVEFIKGVANDLVPVWRYCAPGLLMAYALFFGLDTALVKITGAEWMQLPDLAVKFLVPTFAVSGWLIWSLERAVSQMKLLRRLKAAFDYCNLKVGGTYPSFIEDQPIDDDVRKLKLFVPGIPENKFSEAKPSLEAHWNINIVRIYTEENDKSRINIVYALKDLPKIIHVEDETTFVDGSIPIGRSFSGDITIRLQDMPHMLVAGQSGCGKSNFLKLIVSLLCKNNPEADIHFLDFKNGSELTALKNHFGEGQRNFQYSDTVDDSILFLASLVGVLDRRFKQMKSVGASNFDEYLKRYVSQTSLSTEANKDAKLRKTYIIIDEIAEVYKNDRGPKNSHYKLAKEALNRLARQGRAAGIFLVAATQKPDSKEIDQAVKANMPAVLCFSMSTTAASVAAVGTKRAFDIDPDIKGRAVYKFGPKICEVQTFLFE